MWTVVEETEDVGRAHAHYTDRARNPIITAEMNSAESCMQAALRLLSDVAAGMLIRTAVFDVIRRRCAGAEVKTRIALAFAVVFSAIASLPLASTAVGQEPFPEAPGRATVFLACSQCHSIGKMVQADLTADDWRFIVYDMIARGAPVPDDEIDTVIRYLQDNFASDGN